MRDICVEEVLHISGGANPPILSKSAGEYWNSCMEYVSPPPAVGVAIAAAGLIPGVGVFVAAGATLYTLSAAGICGIGSIQYFQGGYQ